MPTNYRIDPSLLLVCQEIPQTSVAPAKPVEVPTNHVAIIDCSGSMSGELPKIREQLKRRLPKLLKAHDTFSIIWFSGRGQYGTLLEAEPVATLTDLATVNRAIDRWLQPQGLTGFKDPLEEVERLVGRVASKTGNPFALLFMSDGHDNCSGRAEVLSAVEKASVVVQSATFVEYGFYADRPLLTAMAEKSGGTLIFAQDFDQWEPAFDSYVQRRPVGAPRVEVTVEGDPVRGFVWTAQDGDLVTYAVEGGKVRVPETTPAIWYVSPSQAGVEGAKFDPSATSAAYAALSLFSVRMAPEVVLPLLRATGDVALIKKFSGLYGKQKYSEFMEATKAAAFDETKRLVEGYDPKRVPADDAFTVLDVLKLLASDEQNRILLDHPKFKYSRIGRGRVDASSVLTAEEQAEITRLTEEVGRTKDVKTVAELAAKIAAISNKPDPLLFVADPAPEGYPVSSLTYNEEKPNVSFLVRKTGTVDLSKAGAPAGIPAVFPTFVFRNYAVIKDGLVNIDVMPVRLAPATLEALFDAHRAGKMDDDVLTSDGDVTFLNLKALPVINRQMVQSVSAKQLFEDEWSLLNVQAAQKVYNSVLKELAGTKSSAGFSDQYGAEAAEWLKNAGFTDYSGFGPKMVQAESTDVYTAKEMAVSIKSFSSIPSLNEFKKQAAKGKFTPSAALMGPAFKAVEAFMQAENIGVAPDAADLAKAEAWLTAQVKRLDAVRRARMTAKAQAVFAIIVGQTWFTEFQGIDENSMELTIDGQKLACRVEMKEVQVKI